MPVATLQQKCQPARPRLLRKVIGADPVTACDDLRLVEACCGGNQAAWGELVDRYGRLVYSIPASYGMSGADADDVFQCVFTILYRKLETIRDRTRLSAWLIRTTHRECFRVTRRRRHHVEIDETIEDDDTPCEEQAAAWEQQHIVRQALRRLGGRCERLLTALFLSPAGRLSYEVVARKLGLKAGTIGPTRARCFDKLERILIDMGFEP